MKTKIFVSIILFFALASKVLSQPTYSNPDYIPVYAEEEMKKFYIYKTGEDFVNGKKTFYGNCIKQGDNTKFTLDSAGKKIKINVVKMNIFAFEVFCNKKILQPAELIQKYGTPGTYIGGNKYTFAFAFQLQICSDDNGWLKTANGGPAELTVFKVDDNGKPVRIFAPKREKNYKYESIYDLEGLLMEYPDLYSQYLQGAKQADKSIDLKFLFIYQFDFFKKYADRLAADKEGKQIKK